MVLLVDDMDEQKIQIKKQKQNLVLVVEQVEQRVKKLEEKVLDQLRKLETILVQKMQQQTEQQGLDRLEQMTEVQELQNKILQLEIAQQKCKCKCVCNPEVTQEIT